jgi:hypothetical protein
VKVTLDMGCVKYKAQHVVLAVRIGVFTRHNECKIAKNGHFPVVFCEMACKVRVYCSVIGHYLTVGAMEEKSKVQKWCGLCGWNGNAVSDTVHYS